MKKKYTKSEEDQLEERIYKLLGIILKGLYLEKKRSNTGWKEWKIPGRNDMVFGSSDDNPDHIYYDGTFFSFVWKMMGIDSNDINFIREYYPIFKDTLARYLRDQGIIFTELS